MTPRRFEKLVRRLRKLGAVQIATPEGYAAVFAHAGEPGHEKNVDGDGQPAIGLLMPMGESEVFDDDEAESEVERGLGYRPSRR